MTQNQALETKLALAATREEKLSKEKVSVAHQLHQLQKLKTETDRQNADLRSQLAQFRESRGTNGDGRSFALAVASNNGGSTTVDGSSDGGCLHGSPGGDSVTAAMAKTVDAASAPALKRQLDEVTGERDKAVAHAALLDQIVPPLEKVRRDMKTVILDAQAALLSAGVPSKTKPDKDVPFYYGCDSWRSKGEIPWNSEEGRAMTPSEGVLWLAMKRDDARGEAASLRDKVQLLQQPLIEEYDC